ncbi:MULTISPECIES: hypothetical protein [Streptomyces]|uniref:Uncharacterized protein n=1 Tax=Streptomyces gibsoniae TaxID=3075529 RepID=A0ABU2U8H0_9ACTN|nr:hypothetical protein [Streptomyces sp. DSM 41699]MDT0469511.1 hypothetical protein [Streptomyces sp. DSM 41699]
MVEHSVIVEAPYGSGGRHVTVDKEILSTAYSLHDLTVLLQYAGLLDGDELDVAESELIEWHGGGPEVWPRQGGGPNCWAGPSQPTHW